MVPFEMLGQGCLATEAETDRSTTSAYVARRLEDRVILTSCHRETGICKVGYPCGCADVEPSWTTATAVSTSVEATNNDTNIGEPLATTFMFASVRLLAGMGTYMDGEGAALDEALVAVTPSADVGTVIGVDAEVSDEVGLAIELLQIGAGQEKDNVMSPVSDDYLGAGGPGAWELLGLLEGSDRGSSIPGHGPTAGAYRRRVEDKCGPGSRRPWLDRVGLDATSSR
ncbi:MAG: hypothetical protein Q9211_005139 [Gyalolechia sp. 1 TL-2023]